MTCECVRVVDDLSSLHLASGLLRKLFAGRVPVGKITAAFFFFWRTVQFTVPQVKNTCSSTLSFTGSSNRRQQKSGAESEQLGRRSADTSKS